MWPNKREPYWRRFTNEEIRRDREIKKQAWLQSLSKKARGKK